jgi:hypothetical protein
MYFIVINSFFDSSDFSGNPIKKYLEPYIVTATYNISRYYNLNIAFNEAGTNDNYLYDEKEVAYTTVKSHINYPYV